MKAWIGGILIGLVVGIGGVLAYDWWKGPDPRLAQQDSEIASLKASKKKQMEDLNFKLEGIEKINQELTDRLQTAQKELADFKAQQPVKPDAKPPETADFMKSDFMKKAMEQQFRMKLQALKARLNLTPEQLQQLDQIVDRITKGGTSFPPNAIIDVEKELGKILSPEQKQELAKMDQQQLQAGRDMMANNEIAQISGLFDLTEAQKDQIFQKLSDVMADQFKSPGTFTGPDGKNITDPRQILQIMSDRKADALKGILTDDQLAKYREYLDSVNKMAEGFLPKK